jgi:hypothetical protein
MVYFRQLADAALPAGAAREPALLREYLRAMRFLYRKEFVAQRAPDAAGAVADNEPRPALPAIADAAGLTLEQSRLAPIARVAGAPPLADTIWLHRRTVK